MALAVLLACAGAIYQWARTSTDLKRFPPPGQLVDIGGIRLHLVCEGAGTPTVILDAGLGDSWLTWQRIQPEVAKTTRACAYDRAGLGYSDPGPLPRDSRRIVAELHALLARANIVPPYILVGHSFGGFNTRLYAYTYPDEVAALVLVDVSHEDQYRRFPGALRAIIEGYTRDICRQAITAPFGIQRLRGVTAADTLAAPAGERRLAATLGYRSAWYQAQCGEMVAFADSSADEVRTARRPLSIPVYVLDGNAHFAQELEAGGMPVSEADSAAAVWHALHRELTSISPQARLIIAGNSTHYVQFDEPNLVIDAVSDAVAAARAPRAP